MSKPRVAPRPTSVPFRDDPPDEPGDPTIGLEDPTLLPRGLAAHVAIDGRLADVEPPEERALTQVLDLRPTRTRPPAPNWWWSVAGFFAGCASGFLSMAALEHRTGRDFGAARLTSIVLSAVETRESAETTRSAALELRRALRARSLGPCADTEVVPVILDLDDALFGGRGTLRAAMARARAWLARERGRADAGPTDRQGACSTLDSRTNGASGTDGRSRAYGSESRPRGDVDQ